MLHTQIATWLLQNLLSSSNKSHTLKMEKIWFYFMKNLFQQCALLEPTPESYESQSVSCSVMVLCTKCLISIAVSLLSAPLVRLQSPLFPTKYNTRLTTKLNGHFGSGDAKGSDVVCLTDGSRFVASSELVLLRAAHPSFSSWLSEVSPSISSTCGFGFTLANFIKLCSKRTVKSLQ